VSGGAQSQWGFASCLEIRSFGGGYHVPVVSIFRILLQHLPHEKKALDCHGRDFSFGTSLISFVSSSYAVYRLNHALTLTTRKKRGVLLVDVALRMLHPKGDEYSWEELEDIAVLPLAFALTAVRVRLRR